MTLDRGIVLVLLLDVVALAAGNPQESQPATTQAAATQPAETVFGDLTFDAACQRAAAEKKLVMIDFYTVWCMPCKMLDRETWKDEAVGKWLAEKTVAIKVDAEKQRKLAGEYKVNAYPTLLFVRPDKTEAGRIVGFRKPQEFLTEAADAIAGIKRSTRLREQLAGGGENDPMKRERLADELAREGRHAEALEHYLWCFDHGLEAGPGYAGVRLSFLLGDIHDLGRVYPPALAELRKRRDAATDAVLGGRGGLQEAMELSSIDRELGEVQHALEVYDQLGDRADRAAARHALFGTIADALLEARRYADIARDSGNPLQEFARQVKFVEQLKAEFGNKPDSPAASQMQDLINDTARNYEALVGTQRVDEARQLAERLLGFDAGDATYDALIRAARRAGNESLVAELEQQKKQRGDVKDDPR